MTSSLIMNILTLNWPHNFIFTIYKHPFNTVHKIVYIIFSLMDAQTDENKTIYTFFSVYLTIENN